jgi:hypothetical protein
MKHVPKSIHHSFPLPSFMNTKQCVAFAFLYSTSSNQCAYVVYNLRASTLQEKMDLFGGMTLKFDDCYEQPKGRKHIVHSLLLNQLYMYFNSSAIFKLHQIVSICLYANVQFHIDELTKAKTKKKLSTKVQTHHAFNCTQLHSRKSK